MVIIFKGYGNHSNRLFQAIHVEAFCRENNIKFHNPSFSDMAGFYGVKSHSYDSLVCFFLRLLDKAGIVNPPHFEESEPYSIIFLKRRLVFYKGWNFRADDLTKKYRDFFKGKYSLLPKFYEGNKFYKEFASINREEFNVVGVHIRKGDYKTWEGGKYYFSDAIYKKYMGNLKLALEKSSSKETLFIIFSNEKASFTETENIWISENEWYVDQFIMGKCDYLIGPPSTYTLWASYTGQAKYFHIPDDSGNISLEDFACKES
jgi:hypothetical protein